jgi:hypothetical protein
MMFIRKPLMVDACDVADDHADDQGQRREGQEVQHGLARDAADLLQVAHGGDAGGHGQEDHRGDDHLDELDEAVAQRFHGLAQIGRVVAEQDADGDREQDLDVEDPVERELARGGGVGRDVEHGLCLQTGPGGTSPPRRRRHFFQREAAPVARPVREEQSNPRASFSKTLADEIYLSDSYRVFGDAKRLGNDGAAIRRRMMWRNSAHPCGKMSEIPPHRTCVLSLHSPNRTARPTGWRAGCWRSRASPC